MSFCSNCGAKLGEGSKFCRNCGTAVSQNVELPEPSREEAINQPSSSNLSENQVVEDTYHTRKKGMKKIYKICIIIVIVLVLIAAAAIFTSGFAPLRAMYNIDLGNKYLSEGKYDDAISAFEKAIGIDEKNIDSKLTLSDLYIKTGQYDKAESLLEDVLLTDKANQDTYTLLAGIYEKEKNYEELLKTYSEGLSLCKEKDRLQTEYDNLLSRINTSDIEESVDQDEKYTLPGLAQVQIGEEKFELPIDWKGVVADTSSAGTQKIQGTIQYINKPFVINLSVKLKPAVVTEKRITDEGEFYHIDYKVPVVNIEGKYAENAAKLNSAIMKEFNEVQAENSQIVNNASADDFFSPGMKHDFTVNYEVKYNKGGLISILMTYYFFTGGAHGMAYHTAYNYDLVEGKELIIQDLFSKDVNANNVVKEEIAKQMQGNEEFAAFDSISTVYSYTDPFNFYFNEQGVVVWFGQYEIASYSMGMPEFLITRSAVIK